MKLAVIAYLLVQFAVLIVSLLLRTLFSQIPRIVLALCFFSTPTPDHDHHRHTIAQNENHYQSGADTIAAQNSGTSTTVQNPAVAQSPNEIYIYVPNLARFHSQRTCKVPILYTINTLKITTNTSESAISHARISKNQQFPSTNHTKNLTKFTLQKINTL